ncbi:MAG: hypothetical protein ACM3PP_05855, partial [Candidatus Saccharibacteria bacterium]
MQCEAMAVLLDFCLDDRYKGEGVSQGFARGVQVLLNGENLTQEGMGLGAVALRSGGLTYFASSSQVNTSNKQSLTSYSVIDTIAFSGRHGTHAPLLTCLRENASSIYAKIPWQQDMLLSAGLAIRRFFSI